MPKDFGLFLVLNVIFWSLHFFLFILLRNQGFMFNGNDKY